MQQMWEEIAMNSERLALAALTAALLGLIYAVIVHWVYQTDPEHPYTAVLVMIGTTFTLAVALIVVPAHHIVIIAILFAITGLPQIVGSMIRDGQRRRREKAAARHHIEETLS